MENWTKEDFYAFVLLYCANADFEESSTELDIIKNKVSRERFDEVHREFENQNDYQHIETIKSKMKELNLTSDDIEVLIVEMRQLFFADGDYSQTEKNMMMGLKKILSL